MSGQVEPEWGLLRLPWSEFSLAGSSLHPFYSLPILPSVPTASRRANKVTARPGSHNRNGLKGLKRSQVFEMKN